MARTAATVSRPRITDEEFARLIEGLGGFAQIEDVYPASPVQQGILFHSFLGQDTPIYNSARLISMSGRIDVSRLERAWQHVVRRHTVLRAAFVGMNLELPLQVVMRDAAIDVDVLDWTDTSVSRVDRRLAALLTAEHARP